MLRLLLALIFSVLGLFQSDAMSSVVTPPTVPKSGLHSVSDKALTTSFTPVAKVTDGERYTIVHDYLGTPVQAYDSAGDLVWEMLLDVYGRVMECRGDRSLVPFRYQGQYEDAGTGLYYNRFRYYSPEMGMYISSDPIGLAGNNPTLYGYVGDVNTWLDIFGLCKVTTPIGELRSSGKKDAHHVIQDAAVRDLPGYNTQKAPGVQLAGPSTNPGTPHYNATQVQRNAGGGTYGAERRIGYRALREAGFSQEQARAAINEADEYFASIGVTSDTKTRIPGNRKPLCK